MMTASADYMHIASLHLRVIQWQHVNCRVVTSDALKVNDAKVSVLLAVEFMIVQ